MPAAMSHASTMPAPAYIAGFKKCITQFMMAHSPAAGTHANTHKGVRLEFDHAIMAPWSCQRTSRHNKKKALAATRSLVGELEHVGLHLLEPRSLPWRHGVEIHLHDLHPGHHARESHLFRLGLGIGGLDL